MTYKFLSILILSVIFISNSYGQLKKKHLKRIPDRFENQCLITNEREKGRRLSFKELKKGKFVEASQKEIDNYKNVMLLGTGTFLYDYLNDKYPDFQPTVIKPSGMSTLVFIITYKFNDGEILLLRFMDNRKKIWKDIYSVENAKNYSLLICFNIKDEFEKQKLKSTIKEYIMENDLTYSEFTK